MHQSDIYTKNGRFKIFIILFHFIREKDLLHVFEILGVEHEHACVCVCIIRE